MVDFFSHCKAFMKLISSSCMQKEMCSDLILDHKYLYHDKVVMRYLINVVDLLQTSQDENVCPSTLTSRSKSSHIN